MKYQRLQLSAHASIETSLDTNGRYWIAYSSGASVLLRSTAELRKFLKVPKGIPMRERLDAWLEELTTTDTARRERKQAKEGLTPELLTTGFGPECHLDESDPNHATKTVI